MKRLISVLLGMAVGGAAMGADCPSINIKGPCPKEVVCTNLKDVDCPACVLSVPPPIPTICPPCERGNTPCWEYYTTALSEVGHLTAENRGLKRKLARVWRGAWFTPISLMHTPGSSTDGWFDQKWEHKVYDPAFVVDTESEWRLGGGLGYMWPNGIGVSGQVFPFSSDPETTMRWTHKPDLIQYVKTSKIHVNDHRNGMPWMVSVYIPW